MANPFSHDFDLEGCFPLCPACAYELGVRRGVELAKELATLEEVHSYIFDTDATLIDWASVDKAVEELCK